MALKNAGLAVADFERGLKKELLIEKAASMLAPRVSKNETAALAGSILSSDRIGVKILNGESFIKDVSEAEVKAFWEKNKKNFKTEPSFDLEVIDVASIAIAVSDEDIKKEYAENGSLYHKDGKKMSFEEAKEFVAKNAKIKAAKKEALKKYVDLKDAKVKGRAMNDVKLSTTPMPSQVASELVKTSKPTTLKPIQVGESFFVVKVSKVVPSKEMDFAEASKVAKIALQRENASALMKAEGEKLLKSGFEAKDVGFISKNGKNVISGLNEMESMEVAGNVFRSKNIQDSVTLGSKIVLYKVLEQKISDTNGTINDEMVYNKALLNIKAALVNQNVLEYLKSKYEMKLYIKPDSFTKSTKE
jgi:peptidyl-prolyl cis-trans isomerase D